MRFFSITKVAPSLVVLLLAIFGGLLMLLMHEIEDVLVIIVGM